MGPARRDLLEQENNQRRGLPAMNEDPVEIFRAYSSESSSNSGIPVFFSSSGLIPGIEDWASRAQRHRVIMAATDKTKPYSTPKTPKTPFILLGVLALLGVIVALLTSI